MRKGDCHGKIQMIVKKKNRNLANPIIQGSFENGPVVLQKLKMLKSLHTCSHKLFLFHNTDYKIGPYGQPPYSPLLTSGNSLTFWLYKHRYLPSFTFRKAGLDSPSAVDPIPPQKCACVYVCVLEGVGMVLEVGRRCFNPLIPLNITIF